MALVECFPGLLIHSWVMNRKGMYNHGPKLLKTAQRPLDNVLVGSRYTTGGEGS